MSFRNDFYNEVLGLDAIDTDGMPDTGGGNTGLVDTADPRSIFKRGTGDFTGGKAFDYDGRNAVIYRGEDQDLEQTRHDSQTFWGETKAAVGRLVGTTFTKIGSGVGYLAGLTGEALKYASPTTAINAVVLEEGNMISRAADNFISEAFHNLEEGIKERMPIFKSERYREGGVFSKAGTSEFWTDDVVDGVSFMLSSIIPGTQLSKLQIGHNLGKALSGSLLKNSTGKLALPRLKSFAAQTDKVTLSSVMTASEAMFEAKDVRDTVLNDKGLQEKYTEEELKQIAAEKARDAFLLNMLFIAPSNMFEVSSLFNKTSAFRHVPKSRTRMGIKQLEDGTWADATKKGFFNSTPFKVGKALVGNVVAEGLYEENIQYHIQQASRLSAYNDDYKTPFLSTLTSMINNRGQMLNLGTDQERDQSILLGGIIGGGTTAVGNIEPLNKAFGGEGGIVAEEREKKKNRKSLIKGLNDSEQDLTTMDIYEREPDRAISLSRDENGFFIEEEGTDKKSISEEDYNKFATSAGLDPKTGGNGVLKGSIILEEGNPVISTEKLTKLYKTSTRREELDIIHDALSQNPDRNQLMLRFIRNEKLSSLAEAYFNAGLGDILQDKLDFYAEMNPDELQIFGLERAEEGEQQARVKELKDFFHELEVLHNSLDQGVLPVNDSKEERQNNNLRKSVLFDRGQRILTLDKLITRNTFEIDELADKFLYEAGFSDEVKGLMDDLKEAIYQRESYLRSVTSEFTVSSPQLRRLGRSIQDKLDEIVEKIDSNDSKSWFSGNPNQTAARDFLRLSLINEQLTNSSEELFNDWKNISNVNTGSAYFAKNMMEILSKYSGANPLNTLNLNSEVTVKQYKRWEDRQVKILRIKRSLDEQDARINGEKIRNMIMQDVDTSTIIDFILKNNARLTPQVLEIVREIIEEVQSGKEISELKNSVESTEAFLDDMRAELSTAQQIGDGAMEDNATEKIAQAEERLQANREAIAEYEKNNLGVYGSGEGIMERLESLRTEAGTFLDENDIRMSLALEYFGEYDLVKNAFQKDINYDDLASVIRAIQTLDNLERIFSARKRSDYEAPIMSSSRFFEAIDVAIKDLNQIKEEVERRINDRERAELSYLMNHYKSQVDLAEELLPNDFLTRVPKVGDLRDLIEEEQSQDDPDLNKLVSLYEALAMVVKLNLPDDISFNTRRAELLAKVQGSSLINKGNQTENKPQLDKILAVLMENPERSITSILKLFSVRSSTGNNVGFDATPESALYHYFKDGDIHKFITSLDEETRTTINSLQATTEDFKEFAILAREIIALKEISAFINPATKKIALKLEKSITQNIQKDSRLKVPSLQQRHAIYNILTHVLSVVNPSFTLKKFSNFIYLKGPAGSGKALPLDTLVYTKEGPKQLGDLKLGEKIYGSRGLTKVTGIFPQGQKRKVKLVFSDNREVICCEDHLWSFYVNRVNGCEPTTLITKHLNPIKNRLFLPKHSALDFEKNNLLIDPYLLGALIGDGGLSREEVRRLGLDVKSPYKFIPEDYIFTSFHDRIELLRGLMDTDGTIDKKTKSCTFSSSSLQLVKDVQRLCQSLGIGTGKINIKKTTHLDHYRITIDRTIHNIFSLERKSKHYKEAKTDNYTTLESVEYLDEEVEMLCIKVDAEDELFLVEDFVLTHNTNIVLPWVFKMLKQVDSSQVITAGHQEHSALGIKNALASGYDPNTLVQLTEKLKDGTFPRAARFIVVDEIGGVSQEELGEFAEAVQQYSETIGQNPAEEGHVPAVIVLGDPNQITSSEAIAVGIEVPSSTQRLDGIENVRNAATLFTRFRTNNPSILNVQNAFIDQVAPVTGLQSAINVRPEEATEKAGELRGAYVESGTSSLISILKAKVDANPDSKHVIVVESAEKVKFYEDKIRATLGDAALNNKTVEVVFYIDVQGRTLENVYVDLPYNSEIYKSTYRHNQALYTATSRAVSFLYLGNIPNSNVSYSPNLNNLEGQNIAQLSTLKDKRIEQIDLLLAQLPDIEGGENDNADPNQPPSPTPADPSSPEPTSPTDVNDQAQHGIDNDGDRDLSDPDNAPPSPPTLVEDDLDELEPIEPYDGDTSPDEKNWDPTKISASTVRGTLHEPESSTMNIIKDTNGKVLWPGLKAFINANTNVPIEIFRISVPGSNRRPQVIVAHKLADGKYVKLAVLTSAELLKYPGALETSVVDHREDRGIIDTQGEIPTSTIKGEIDGTTSNSLQYNYDLNTEPTSLNVSDVFNRWKNSFFGHISDDHELTLANETEVRDNLRVKIFDKEAVREFKGDMVPVKGVPYLVISGWKRNGATTPGKPQLIRLDPRKINMSKDSELMAPILHYIERVKEIELLLKQKYNWDIQLGDRAFHRAITRISNIWASQNISDYQATPNLDPNDKLYGEIVQAVPNIAQEWELLEKAKELDEMVHGKWDDRKNKSGKYQRRYQGEAQKSFNKIARANLFVHHPESKVPLVLRDTRPVEFLSRKAGAVSTKNAVVGRSLLGAESKKFSYEPEVEESLRRYEASKAEREGKPVGEYYNTMPTTRTIGASNRMTFTSEELEIIFSFDESTNTSSAGTSTTNDNFGLRLPISRTALDKTDISDLDLSQFNERFAGVSPTRVNMTLEGQEEQQAIPLDDADAIRNIEDQTTEQKSEEDLANDLDLDLDIMGDADLTVEDAREAGVDLGEELTLSELEAMYRKYLPGNFLRAAKRWVYNALGKDTQDKEIIQILDAISLAKKAGKRVYGRYERGAILLAGIDSATNKAYSNVLRHELIHKVVNEYLTPQERLELFRLAKQENPDLHTLESFNEHLANRFMTYRDNPRGLLGKMKWFFDKILRFFGFIKTYNQDINEFFDKVASGWYRTQRVKNPTLSLNKSMLEEYFNSDIALYQWSENALLSTISTFHNPQLVNEKAKKTGKIPVPLTFEEAKSAAYKKIVNAHKTLASRTELGPQLQRWKEASAVLSNYSVFEEMIKKLYGHKGEKIKAQTETGKLGALSVVNLSNEIQQVQYEDPRSNIIAGIKQALATIKKNANEYVPFGQAYVMLIDAIGGIDSSTDSWELQKFISKSAFIDFDHTEAGQALKNYILELIAAKTPNAKNKYFDHPWVEFRNDDTVYIDGQKQLDLTDINYTELDSLPEVNKFTKSEGENQQEFMQRVYDTYLSNVMTREDWANQYKIFRASNEFATIVTTVGSMRGRVPMVGVREYGRSGGIEYSYFANRLSGSKPVYISELINTLEVYLLENEDAFENYDLSSLGKEADKEAIIKSFLQGIGFNRKVNLGTKAEVDSLLDDLKFLIRKINNRPAGVTITDVLYDETKFFQQLAILNHTGSNTVAPVNYITGGGKRVYTRHNSSFGFEVLKYLQSLIGKGVTQNTFSYLNLDYYKNNIFIKGINSIYRYIDHDSIKFKGIDTSAIEYTKEGPLDWMSRVFNHAWTGHILSQGQKTKKYIQFVYPISNKPNIAGVEVDVLSNAEIRKALQQMLWQQAMLPELDNVAGYTSEKNYLPGNSVGEIFNHMNERAEMLVDFMIENNFNVDSRLGSLYDSLPFLKSSKERIQMWEDEAFNEKYTAEMQESMTKEELQEARDKFNQERQESGELLRNTLRPLVRNFYYNQYVNSKQVNNLLMGPEAFYKPGHEPYDIVKRASIAFAPGRKGAIKDGKYLPKQSRVIISEDLREEVDFVKGIAEELMGEQYEPSDAQGFVTPAYLKKLQKSYGISSELDVVMKPVYFGIDEQGVPRALKLATITLTDELIDQYPQLGIVRDQMEANNADIFTFASAVKVGEPKNLTKLYDDNGDPLVDGEIPSSIEPGSIITIDNAHMRIQHNPAHEPTSLSTNPSQLTYMGVTSPENLPMQAKIHTLNAELIKVGHKLIDRMLKLKHGKRAGGTVGAVKSIVARQWRDLAGAETEYSLIKDAGVSLNLPLLIDKTIASLTSKITRESVDFKLKGSKLVLQSEFGTYPNKITNEELKWKDENGFTEVYLPQELAEGFNVKEGDEIIANTELFRAIGYRLPSTGMHSAIALKIKGFYPAPPGSRANVIIAPKRLVFVHGSDFDVDGLFVLSRTLIKDISSDSGDINLGAILSGISEEYNSDLLLDANSIINYNSKLKRIKLDEFGNTSTKGRYSFGEFLAFVLDDINNRIENLYDVSGTETKEAKEARLAEVDKLKVLEEQIIELYSNSLKNELVDTYVDMITSMANRRMMELPITMDRLKGAKGPELENSMLDIVAEMRGLNKSDFIDEDGNFDEKAYKKERDEKYLYPEIDLSDVLNQMQVHYNTFSGNVLTGAGSNSFKVISYLFAATKTTKWVHQEDYDKFIKSDKEVFSGKTYTRAEIIEKGEGSLSEGLARFSEEGIDLIDYRKEAPTTSKPITINGVTYKDFSYTEKRPNAEGNLVDNVVPVGRNPEGELVNRPYTIWETLDSLVNAAIDNVKEQILYLINMTDKTANQMFSMIALGIPLPTIIRIMAQPAILGLKYKKRIDTQLINNERKAWKLRYATKIGLIEQGVTEVSEDVEAQIDKAIEQFDLTDETLTNAAQMFNLSKESTPEYYLTQIKTLEVFSNATEIGEDIFTGSRVSQILRKYPGKYAESKQIEDDILNKVSNFGTSKYITNEIEQIKAEIRETEEYQNAPSKSQYMKAKLAEIKESRGILLKSRRTTYNQLMRQTHTGYTQPADNWTIPNASLLSVPNFRQATIGLLKLNRLYEQLMFKHSEVVNKFLNRMLEDVYSRSTETKYKQIEAMKNELITFLNTSLSFYINDQLFDLSIPEGYTSKPDKQGKTAYGFKGWSQDLIGKLQKLKKDNPDNLFLSHLEFNYDRVYKERTIVFTSDKVSDPIQSLLFKQAFADLANPEFREGGESLDNKYSQLQVDLFKYLALSRGVGFGRTSYSTLIPDMMYKAFDSNAAPLYKSLLLSDGKHVDESGILNSIYDQFLLQYLQNNPSKIKSLDNTDERIIRAEQTEGKKKKEGAKASLGGTFGNNKHYDLKLRKAAGKFIKYYRHIYVLVHEAAETIKDKVEQVAYYQRVSRLKKNRYYTTNNRVLSNGFDITKAFNGTPVLPAQVPNGGLINETLYISPIGQAVKLDVGTIFYAKDQSDVGATNMKSYRVESHNEDVVLEKGTAFSYNVYPVSQVNTSKDVEGITPVELTVDTAQGVQVDINTRTERARSAEQLFGFNSNTSESSDVVIDKLLAEEAVPQYLKDILIKFKGRKPTLINFRDFLYNKKRKGFAHGVKYGDNIHISLSSHSNFVSMAETIAHELTHLYTFDVITNGQNGQLAEGSKELEWYNNLKEMYELAKASPIMQDRINSGELTEYALSNMHEFVAFAFTDPLFQLSLGDIQYSEKLSLWERFINMLKSLLGFEGRANKTFNVLSSVWSKGIPQYGYERGSEPLSNTYSTSIRDIEIDQRQGNVVSNSKYRALELTEEDLNKMENTLLSGTGLANDPAANNDYLSPILNKIRELNPILTDDQLNYIDNNRKLYDRLTSVTNTEFTTSQIVADLAELLTIRDFKRQGKEHSDIIRVQSNTYTFKQRVEHYNKSFNTGKSKGRYAHLLIEQLLEKNPVRKKSLLTQMDYETKGKIDNNGTLVQESYSPETFDWIEKRLGDILKKSGLRINFKNEIYNDQDADKLIPEQVIVSPSLGIGTRVDGIVEHPNGEISLLDWKTGNLLSDLYTNEILKYGTGYGLNNSKLNKAKLEVMFRAFMMKEINPDINFKTLTVNHLNKDTDVRLHHVEVDEFLKVIENFVKDKHADKYQDLLDKGLFRPEVYKKTVNLDTSYANLMRTMTLEQKRQYLDAEIERIVLENTPAQLNSNVKLNAKLQELTKHRAELIRMDVKGLDFDKDGADLSNLTMERLTSNIKDVNQPWAVALKERILNSKDKWIKNYTKNETTYDDLTRKLLAEYLEERPGTSALAKTLRNKINYLPILGGVSKKELFGFMWRKYDTGPVTGWHANMRDTYFDEALGEEVPLTETQKAYRDNYHSSMKGIYGTAMQAPVFNQYGKKVTKAVLQKLPHELHEFFMPRVHKTMGDLAEENENLGLVPKALKRIFTRNYAAFLEGAHYGNTTRGVPLRYYAGLDSDIIQGENFSFDADRAYKQFTRNVLFKEQMDGVYAFGQGVIAYLNSPDRADENGKPKYPQLSQFIEDHLLLHVVRNNPGGEITGKEARFAVSEQLANSNMGKLFNLTPGYHYVNVFRLGQRLKYFVSMAGMALKPIRGAFNGALIFVSNHLKGAAGSVAKGLFGVKEVDYTLKDVIAADALWAEHLAHWMKGSKSKLQIMTEKLKFLPDNYDFLINQEDQVVVKNSLFDRGKLYWFHQIFENYGSMTMLAATLKGMKIQTKDGVKSMWDLYDNNGEYQGPVRGKLADGTEMKGLDERETQHLKRVYERIHGSYRQEERLALELSVLGQWTLQFKKYLPTIFKQQFNSKGVDYSLGQYVLKTNEDGSPVMDEDGVGVYEWEGKLTQGRVNIMLATMTAHLMNWAGLDKNKFYSDDFLWENLSEEQKQQFTEGTVLLLTMVLAPLLLLDNYIDDDDENKRWARAARKLAEDISLGMNIGDLLRPIKQPWPVITKMLDVWDFSAEYLTDGIFQGETDSRGLPKGAYSLIRTLPYGSSLHQWNSFLDEINKEYTVWDFNQRPLIRR